MRFHLSLSFAENHNAIIELPNSLFWNYEFVKGFFLVKVKSRLVCGVRCLSWVRHPWYLALLISSFVALQRGICVTFMGGFSAGYDAVAIPPYRHPVYKSPSHPTTHPTHPPPSPIIVVVAALFCPASDKKKCQLFLGRELLTRLNGERFTVGRLNKWAWRNPIKVYRHPSVERQTVLAIASPHHHPFIPAACRQFKLIINASANIVVIFRGLWRLAVTLDRLRALIFTYVFTRSPHRWGQGLSYPTHVSIHQFTYSIQAFCLPELPHFHPVR